MPTIPDSFRDLFDKPTFAHIATLLPDGTPHSVPVWIDYDADDNLLLVNTVRGSRKEQNIDENCHVAVSMTDPDDPYRFLSVRGEVAELTEDGAVEHVNRLAQRYLGVEEYPRDDEGARVVVKIRPNSVTARDENPDRD
ncbi:pyridoxamine 5'-phosphate oxidase family protein [Halorussus lipolyticus]|uniref:pyridoxamine 5'-phosphate oxidase family protein n=1 Tax=Halorussus lipolyticus TaxID=3034024 RepID=UPI0023E884F3|nr:PPOX class F420-dependent oxidoreductase [Halorussus sp. DT80]